MKLHLQSLLEEMVQEEVVLKDKLVESVNSCSAELAQLCEQLSLPCELPPETATLLTKEKLLRTKVDSLAKVRKMAANLAPRPPGQTLSCKR